MKRLRWTICLIICLFLITPTYKNISVSAENHSYLRIIESELPFFADENGVEFMFFLPYTYYVKLLERGEILCKIEYGSQNGTALVGYVPTSGLFEDNLSVTNPYPNLKIKTSRSAVLYANAEYSQQIQYVFSGREMNFLGYSRSNDGVYSCFVEYNGTIGYVKDTELLPFDLLNHPNELTFLKPEPTPTPDKPTITTTFDLKYLIIACLLIAGLLALVFVFRKVPSSSPAVSYYDENDYE